jgi:hypothetical protein
VFVGAGSSQEPLLIAGPMTKDDIENIALNATIAMAGAFQVSKRAIQPRQQRDGENQPRRTEQQAAHRAGDERRADEDPEVMQDMGYEGEHGVRRIGRSGTGFRLPWSDGLRRGRRASAARSLPAGGAGGLTKYRNSSRGETESPRRLDIARHGAGVTFWFRRKTLCGSYWAFTARRRTKRSPYAPGT